MCPLQGKLSNYSPQHSLAAGATRLSRVSSVSFFFTLHHRPSNMAFRLSTLILVGLFVCLSNVSAASARPETGSPNLRRRDPALAKSPSGNYAPTYIQCPQDPFVRAPNDKQNQQTRLGKGESDYIKDKAAQSIPLWQKYLENVKLENFNIDDFLKSAKQSGGVAALTLPNIGLALSGGGMRALCFSGSILDSFDSRNQKANEAKVGGILQLANYAVGVSGASWLLGSWATSNFPQIQTLVPNWRLSEDNSLWDWNIAKDYWSHYKTVQEKRKAGFPVSIVDAWGRILSRHFINEPDKKNSQKGKEVLWSSIRETSGYKRRDVPFVMAVTTSRPDKGEPFTPESPTYEFSAEEFGIFNPYLNASIPIEHLGSTHTAGNPDPQGCVAGFDNAGFVMGMSSNIFSRGDSPRHEKRPKYLTAVRTFINDINFEGKIPNAFKGLGKTSAFQSARYQDTDRDLILMADSGLIHENIPLFPLIQPERKLDVIIALDASADGSDEDDPNLYTYPNGTHMYSIYTKTKLPPYKGYHMPSIPNALDGTFTKLGYNKRPTFFGCEDRQGPLIVYLPNYYATGKTNTVTTKISYKPEEIDEFFFNGFALATQSMGPTQNKDWPMCLACALVDRQVLRNSAVRSAQCQACFKAYCDAP
ncbi:uncharacterized protein PGTG_09117 [Puccinia graminis f. sp. tritici CRL 75-36-700-3]|uniref:Lysophospholipase n=2 Tax=Puccinia graminis f. sp. tritici TaxID=56615 RepID=E3KG68_PUCGT|nr:uncharacterized protein PGTG_09117 [Puccinia graminis f. sp. tritici CRL 75-36-700-3]EFP83164.2 hypothetical protein PGTG_09117 [Puccinia graminis f. sp. tritici CRL 75-36-700-3]